MGRSAALHLLRLCAALQLGGLALTRDDQSFAVLVNSLKTFQVHACDDEEMHIWCPNRTVISLNFVRYGRPAGPGNGQCLEPQHGVTASSFGPKAVVKECSSKNAFKIVEKYCQEHSMCRFMVRPKTFQEDPCPQVRKYAEVAHKCRPYEFENRMACENDKMVLKCPKPLKIIIYSAFFGSTKNGTIECPLTLGRNNEVCESSYTTEEALSRCFGRDECTLWATSEMFGAPLDCSPQASKFLKVVFTCVPSEVLLHEGRSTESASYSEGHFYSKWLPERNLTFQNEWFDSRSTASGVEMQQDSTSTPPVSNAEDRRMMQFFATWIAAHKFMESNRQKLLLYMCLSLSVGVLLFVVAVWLGFILRGNSSAKQEKPNNHPITDDDFFSDSDLEHYEGEEFASSANSTMMRKFSEAIPRAPVKDGPQTNHFFS